MKSTKINYVAVGVFVIATLGALIVALATLSGRTGATDAYHAVYANVTGVKFGTQVLYEGYPIGQVEEVTPVEVEGGMKFRVDFTVQEGWKIPEDSQAQIRAPGLLSAITISIEAGDSPTPLKPGAAVISKEAANIFAVVSSVAGDLSNLAETSLKPLLANLDRTVSVFGDILEKDGQRLVGEVISMIGEVNGRIPTIAANVETFSNDMSHASKELSAFLTPDNRKKMEDMIANLNRASNDIQLLMASANALMASTEGLVSNADAIVAGNRDKVDATVTDLRYVTESLARHVDAINQNLEGTARNMYEFSRQIRQNPGLLLGGTPPKDEGARR